MKNKSVLVFSGYNDRAVIAFLRECRRLAVDVAVIASGADDFIFKTSYRDKVVFVRQSKRIEIAEVEAALKGRGKEIKQHVLLPSTEYLNRFALSHRTELEELGVTVPLVNAELYAAISDKYSFGEMCRRHGLRVPREYQSFSDIKDYPVVAKPRAYFSAQGGVLPKPVFLNSTQQLAEFAATHRQEDWYFQEFIAGDSLYLLCYIACDGKHVFFSQKNLVQQGGGRSIVAATPADLHQTPLAQSYRALFEKEGFHGLVMVELRSSDREYVMIEANPRLWGPSQLFVDAGIPIFSRFLEEAGVVAVHPSEDRENRAARYFWEAGLCGGDGCDFHGISAADWQARLAEFKPWDIFSREDCNVPTLTNE